MQRWRSLAMIGLALLPLGVPALPSVAEAAERSSEKSLYRMVERKTGLDWHDVAALDRYETAIRSRRRQAGIPFVPAALWYGIGNLSEDTHTATIHLWNGVGRDGDGDGLASPDSRADALLTLVSLLTREGHSRDAWRRALWSWYEESVVVERITKFSEIIRVYDHENLSGHCFVLPKRFDAAYRDSWGDKRGWGGRRMHEGCDLFAGYGTPVLSCTYGFVETIGWNKYGGWRVGVRGIDNTYYYYAHLGGYAKGIRYGTLVKPGNVIGYVGSSGYGKPGTSGKFPPHLHFGMYRDSGQTEWAYDPYPYLRQWQRQRQVKR